jgi:hypothetical protein
MLVRCSRLRAKKQMYPERQMAEIVPLQVCLNQVHSGSPGLRISTGFLNATDVRGI